MRARRGAQPPGPSSGPSPARPAAKELSPNAGQSPLTTPWRLGRRHGRSSVAGAHSGRCPELPPQNPWLFQRRLPRKCGNERGTPRPLTRRQMPGRPCRGGGATQSRSQLSRAVRAHPTAQPPPRRESPWRRSRPRTHARSSGSTISRCVMTLSISLTRCSGAVSAPPTGDTWCLHQRWLAMILLLLPGCWQYSWALTGQIPRISFGGVQVRALRCAAVQSARAASPRGCFRRRQHPCSLGAWHLAADCHAPRVQSAIPL